MLQSAKSGQYYGLVTRATKKSLTIIWKHLIWRVFGWLCISALDIIGTKLIQIGSKPKTQSAERKSSFAYARMRGEKEGKDAVDANKYNGLLYILANLTVFINFGAGGS